MNIKLKDVIHFYIGCEFKIIESGETTTFDFYYTGCEFPVCTYNKAKSEYKFEEIKLILRPLSDMTIKEAKEFFNLPPDAEIYRRIVHTRFLEFNYKWKDENYPIAGTKDGLAYSGTGLTLDSELKEFKPTEFLYLLKNNFDLFGLIKSGQAVEITYH